MTYQQPQQQFQSQQDVVSGDQYRYALTNFVSSVDGNDPCDGSDAITLAYSPRKGRAATAPTRGTGNTSRTVESTDIALGGRGAHTEAGTRDSEHS